MSLFKTLFLLVFMVANAAFAAQNHPIGFKVWTGPVPQFVADPNSNVALANDAFLRKYGAERGLLGTVVGRSGSLVVLMANQMDSRQLWRKMLGAGDVYTSGSFGYFVFESGNNPLPTQRLQFLGRMDIAEGSTGRLVISNGTPEITSYVVVMEEKCGLARSGVIVALPGTPVSPTRLVSSTRSGRYSIAYEHEVNGGFGALLSGITVSIARRGGPIIIDVCPVDVYARF